MFILLHPALHYVHTETVQLSCITEYVCITIMD